MYIGLALFRRGDYALAASQWLEAMRNAIAVSHARGAAGSVEGCAYLAARMDDPTVAARLLSAAAEIRRRTGMPLFSFWVRHNEEVTAELVKSLGAARYSEAVTEGIRLRQEDVVNEAASLLRVLSAGAGA